MFLGPGNDDDDVVDGVWREMPRPGDKQPSESMFSGLTLRDLMIIMIAIMGGLFCFIQIFPLLMAAN